MSSRLLPSDPDILFRYSSHTHPSKHNITFSPFPFLSATFRLLFPHLGFNLSAKEASQERVFSGASLWRHQRPEECRRGNRNCLTVAEHMRLLRFWQKGAETEEVPQRVELLHDDDGYDDNKKSKRGRDFLSAHLEFSHIRYNIHDVFLGWRWCLRY